MSYDLLGKGKIMKRLVGGDYLLDLSSIELEESEDGSTKTNITDSDVLEQLTNLKKYINNPEMAKPVWVKLVNGENDELVIARGTFSVVDTGEFEICVQLDGYKLVIFIEFTQVLNSDDEPLDDWYIDTNDAKYLFTSDAQNIGAISELPVFENIVDKEGHKRFIEGDIALAEGVVPTKIYGKWSLSGTHLMIVLCLAVKEDDVVPYTGAVANITLPTWLLDKIVPLASDIIVYDTANWQAEDNSFQTGYALLRKQESNLFITLEGFTATEDRQCRLAFDLLIDNE